MAEKTKCGKCKHSWNSESKDEYVCPECGFKRHEPTDEEIKERWDKKKEHLGVLANVIRKIRYNVSVGLKSEDEKEFLTSLVVAIMDKTGERIGNENSAEEGHVGITGLTKDHVTVTGNSVLLQYVGKSGVEHEKSFCDDAIADGLKRAIKNSPEDNIFCTSDGFKIKADKVNRFLQEFSISAKDIRGFSVNKWVTEKIKALTEIEEEPTKRKRQFNKILKFVAKKIGHGAPTLKKHYLMPEVENEFLENGKAFEIKDLYQEGGKVQEPDSPKTSMGTVLTEKQFLRKFAGQHKDLRSKTHAEKEAVKKSILENGFASSTANTLPIFTGRQTDAISTQYGNRKGDIVYLLREAGISHGGNGQKTKLGYKPEPTDVVYIEYDGQPSWEAYNNQFDKSTSSNVIHVSDSVKLVSNKDKSGKGTDLWYDIISGAKVLGNIVIEEKIDYYQVVDVNIKSPKQGIGTAVYTALGHSLNKPLYSDPSLTDAAIKLWDRLIKLGIAEKYEKIVNVDTDKTKKSFIREGYRTINSKKMGNGGKFADSDKNNNFTGEITQKEIQDVIQGKSHNSKGTTIEAAADYLRKSAGTGQESGGEDFSKKAEIKLLAPNGKPSKLTPEQYRITRESEFLLWFGNWWNIGFVEKLLQTPNSTKINRHIVRPDRAGEKEIIKLLPRTSYMLGGNRTVDITKGSYKHTLIHGGRDEVFYSIFNFESLCKNAVLFDYEHNHNHKSLHDYIVGIECYMTIATFNGERYIARLTVRVGENNQRFLYDVNVVNEKTIGLVVNGKLPSRAADGSEIKDRKFNLLLQTFPENISQVIDTNGEPMPVSHGTDKSFTVFKEMPDAAFGYHFSGKKEYAESYGNVLEVFLNAKNLYRTTEDAVNSGSGLVPREAFENGYDGWCITYSDGTSDYAVFNPNQIKLADGTNTTFDAKNPDIRYGNGGEVQPESRKAYLMTLDEYTSNVIPLVKDFRKFLSKNNYFQNFSYGGYWLYSYPELEDAMKNRVDLGHFDIDFSDTHNKKRYGSTPEGQLRSAWSVAAPRDATQDIIDKKNAYISKLIEIFDKKYVENSLADADNAKTNKRSIRYAIENNIYSNLLKEGKVEYELIEAVAKSAGVNLPKKVMESMSAKKLTAKKYAELYSSIPSVNRDKLAELIDDIEKSYEEFRKFIADKEYQRSVDNISKIQSMDEIRSTQLAFLMPYSDVFIEPKVKRTEEIVTPSNRGKLYDEKETIYYMHIPVLTSDWENALKHGIDEYVESLKIPMFKSILSNFTKISLPISEFRKLSIDLGYKGFEGAFEFTFKGGGQFTYETKAILAGGYNIQVAHLRYLSDFKNVTYPNGEKKSSMSLYGIVENFSDKKELQKRNNPFMIVDEANDIEGLINGLYEYLKETNRVNNVRKAKESISYKNQHGRSKGIYFSPPITLEQAKEKAKRHLTETFGIKPEMKEGGTVDVAETQTVNNISELIYEPAFIEWFGNWVDSPESASKVVDKSGKPRIVYHGLLHKKFNQFKNLPAFFSIKERFAYDYAATKSQDRGLDADIIVVPVFLNLRKLFNPANPECIEDARINLPDKANVSHGQMWFLSADIPKDVLLEQMQGIITILPDRNAEDIQNANIGDVIKVSISMSQYENRILVYKDEDWGYTIDERYFMDYTENALAEYVLEESGGAYGGKQIKYKGKYHKSHKLNEETYRLEPNSDPLYLEFLDELKVFRADLIQNIYSLSTKEDKDDYRYYDIPTRGGKSRERIYIKAHNLKTYKDYGNDSWTMFENKTVQEFLVANNYDGWIAVENGVSSYGVFAANNIKLADGSNDTFNSDSKDIRYKSGGGLNLYHGSSSKFDEFDESKIGTGEGSDLFGSGFYLTDNKDVADFYAHIIAKKKFITKYTNTGIFGTPEPVFEKDADKKAAEIKVVNEFIANGKFFDTENCIIDAKFESHILEVCNKYSPFGSEAASRAFEFMRANKSDIHEFRGELEYIVKQAGMGDRAIVDGIIQYVKDCGYDGIKYPTTQGFEGIKSYNYVIFNKSILRNQQNVNLIVCENCGWSWLKEDGGEDTYVCHKCGHDNTAKYLGTFAKGGHISSNSEVYKKWEELVNMTPSELNKFMETPEGKAAGLTKDEAHKLGIHSGQESARWILKMKDTPVADWTPEFWEWAKRQIAFISRMKAVNGDLRDADGNMNRKLTALLIWGHNPDKYESGGNTSLGDYLESDKLKKDWAGQYEMVPIEAVKSIREFHRVGEDVNKMFHKDKVSAQAYIDKMKKWIATNGWESPLMVDYFQYQKKALLTEGNHRLEAADQMGYKYVPIAVFRTTRDDRTGKAKPVRGYISKRPEDSYVPANLLPSQIGLPTLQDIQMSKGGKASQKYQINDVLQWDTPSYRIGELGYVCGFYNDEIPFVYTQNGAQYTLTAIMVNGESLRKKYTQAQLKSATGYDFSDIDWLADREFFKKGSFFVGNGAEYMKFHLIAKESNDHARVLRKIQEGLDDFPKEMKMDTGGEIPETKSERQTIIAKIEKQNADKNRIKYKIRKLINYLSAEKVDKFNDYVKEFTRDFKAGIVFNKTKIEKLGAEYGIDDQNIIKELTELALVQIARDLAHEEGKTVKEKFDSIVGLYNNQVNLSHRTSESVLFQQYSTPAPIGYLMGVYCGVDNPELAPVTKTLIKQQTKYAYKKGDKVFFKKNANETVNAEIVAPSTVGEDGVQIWSTSKGYASENNMLPKITSAKKESIGQGYKSFKGIGGGSNYIVEFADGKNVTSFKQDRDDAIAEAIWHRLYRVNDYPKTEIVEVPVEVIEETPQSDKAEKLDALIKKVQSLNEHQDFDGLNLPSVIKSFYAYLKKSSTLYTWSIYGKGFAPFNARKITEFFWFAYKAYGGDKSSQEILERVYAPFKMDVIAKAEHQTITFKDGRFMNIITSQFKGSNTFYAGTQYSQSNYVGNFLDEAIKDGVITLEQSKQLWRDPYSPIVEDESEPKKLYFEPSAGNGMLTVAGYPDEFIVNELSDFRNRNLKTQGYREVLKLDAENPIPAFYHKFDGVLTNPPFGSLDEKNLEFNNFKITSLEHLMSIRALETMKDNGKAAIIIGGHTKYDSEGRIQSGKNRIYFSYLCKMYNVEDVIQIDGAKLYSRMGTSFNTRLILINGRKKEPSGYAPLKIDALPEDAWSAHPVRDYETFFTRVISHLEN